MLCTYNGERYLAQQLTSLANQELLPDVLFVQDDCSTDSTWQIVRSFAEDSPFPVSVDRNRQRLGYNRNFASVMTRPTSDLIAFCDQDDLWYPEKLSILSGLLEADASLAAACADARCIDAEGGVLGGTVWGRLNFDAGEIAILRRSGELGILLRHNVVPASCMVVRSSFRDLIVPFTEHGFYDYWIAILLKAVSNISFADELLGDYRIHGDNAVGLSRPGPSLGRAPSLRSRHQNHLEQSAFSRDVLERVTTSRYPVTRACLEQIEGWAEFSDLRSNLPANPLRRFAVVTRNARSGAYATHTASAMSAVYDAILG